MRPQRPYRALRATIGSIAVLTLLGVWVYSRYSGQSLDTLWEVAVLVVIFAGAVAVFGSDTFDDAAETAKDIGGDGGGSSEDGGGTDATESSGDN